MPFDKSYKVWKDGGIIRWDQAAVHLSAHTMHYGTGVFEGIRCYNTRTGPAVFRLEEHVDRLYASAGIYGIEIPYPREQICSAIHEVIRENRFSDCYVRPIVYYGSDSLGVHPRNCPVEATIMAWPWAPYLGAEGLEKGVKITVSPWRKFHGSMIPTTAKGCGGYLNSMLALKDAVKRGFDEALFLDMHGNVSEGTGENIFVVKKGRLLTNDEKSSILLGITRDSVLRIAADLGYEVKVGTIRLFDLQDADEAFFTGTAAEVTPIREVDGRIVGEGKRGPVTGRIQEAFFAAAGGKTPGYEPWLSCVEKGIARV